MPIRSFQSRCGSLPIGACGDEHQGAPLDDESSDRKAASRNGELSDVTGIDSLTSLSVLTVSRFGAIRSEWLCSTFTRLELPHDFTGNGLNLCCRQIARHCWISLRGRALSRRCRCQEEGVWPRVQDSSYPIVIFDSSLPTASELACERALVFLRLIFREATWVSSCRGAR